MGIIYLRNRHTPAPASKRLGDILRESRWDRIIGTWVDADTKGAESITTYAWKYPNETVLEARTHHGAKESVAFIGVNDQTNEIYHVGMDNTGTHSHGRWVFKKNEALLELEFAMAKNHKDRLRVRYTLEGNDTMIATIDLPEPIVFKWIRQNTGLRH